MFPDDDSPYRRAGGATWKRPFQWWGPPWHTPRSRRIAELVELEMLSDAQARWLLDHVAQGGSLLVASTPQGAGKSTLADALTAELSDDRVRVYLRGMYEPFDWVSEAEPASTTIFVNEISPHLPVYAWGGVARRLLELGEDGYQIIGTIHADSVEELVTQLAAYPIQATAAQLAALDVVVFIAVDVAGDDVERRVRSIVSLSLDEATAGLIARPVTT